MSAILTSGSTLAHYRIDEVLGQGGMGKVFRAWDSHLDRHVALKVLPAEMVANADRKSRFVREAKAASALSHPNIVTIHDITREGDIDFIVMECVPGKTLAQSIPPEGLPVEQAARWGVQIAGAMGAAHRAGIIHRDLKPANIMVTPEGIVKVLDFGLAKLLESAPAAENTRTMTVETAPHVVMGTVPYMSPEQASGDATDARSDVFSFGAILYEMLSGHRAFPGDTLRTVLESMLRERFAPLAGLPAAVDALVRKCLRANPGERYQSAGELLRALENLDGQAKRTPSLPSIAVLPFLNLTPDPENEFFGDGLAEDIIDALTRLPALRVTARTSAFAFRGSQQDVRRIAGLLDVALVLEGSVRRAGNRVRVTAQLVRGEDGSHVWSERFDRELHDVFAIQDEISHAIAGRLSAELPRARSQARQPSNLEAYNLYLEGRHHLYRWTPEGFARSKACLDRSIALDPDYALAHDALAELYWYMGFLWIMPPKETFSQAILEAHRALEIDDTLGEAHAMLGMLRKELDCNWEEVRREVEIARNLNPGSSAVRLRRAISYCMPLGRLEEAERELADVVRADPLSLCSRLWLAVIHMLQGRADTLLEHGRAMKELDPGSYLGSYVTGTAQAMLGNYDGAVAEFRQAVQLSGSSPVILGWLGWTHARYGRVAEAEAVLQTLAGMASQRPVPPTSFAWIYAGLGDADRAFAWMEKAVAARDHMLVPLRSYPHLDPLRSDPRFTRLLEGLNLTDATLERVSALPI